MSTQHKDESFIQFDLWVNGDYLRFLIADGESIQFREGSPHDEGYTYTGTTISRDGSVLYMEEHTTACDCDGPLEKYFTAKADMANKEQVRLANHEENYRRLIIPLWQKIKSEQHNHWAEEAGY